MLAITNNGFDCCSLTRTSFEKTYENFSKLIKLQMKGIDFFRGFPSRLLGLLRWQYVTGKSFRKIILTAQNLNDKMTIKT